MNNLENFKRRMVLEREDEANKRRRLTVGSNATAFLNTTSVSTGNGLGSPTVRLPSLVGTPFALHPTPLESARRERSAVDDALLQLLAPSMTTAPSPLQSASLQRTTCGALEELALMNLHAGTNNLLETTLAARVTPSFIELLRVKREEQEIQKQAAELLRAKKEGEVANLLLNRPSTSVTALLLNQSQASSVDSLLTPRFSFPSNLVQPGSLFRPDELDAKAAQLADMSGSIGTLSGSRLKGSPRAKLSTVTENLTPPPPEVRVMSTALTPELKPLQDTKNPSADFSPLGVEEDSNWLSEMHCFLRSEIVEVFHVENSKLTGRSTSKGLSAKQVGIRCRWCANMPPESRVSRSSAFPSSLRQLYQSFTMMVRDHFGPNHMCTAIPAAHREHLNHLRHSRNSQGASDSKHYWVHAAHKIGLSDTDKGIQITEESKAAGKAMGNFGAPAPEDTPRERTQVVLLVKPEDLNKSSMFFYSLLLQCQLVHLNKSELVAKRRTLSEGLEGIGCRHCCAAGRYGFSRRFPLRRRSLPEEVMDMYCHMKRCPLCPNEVKELLTKLHAEHESAKMTGAARFPGYGKDARCGKDPHKEFFDVLWTRLGRTHDIKTS